jgi:hypothetical protein
MSEVLERFVDDAVSAADLELAGAIREIAENLELLRRRNLVVFELGRGAPASVIVKAPRGGQTILWIGAKGSVGMWGEPSSIDIETWRIDRAIVDSGAREDVLGFVERRALELLRNPDALDAEPEPPASGDSPRFPLSIRALAARIVDLAIGAPLGTTVPTDVAWHSPPIALAYNRYYEMHGRGGGPIDVDRATHDAVLDRFRRRIAADGAEAVRRQFAHTLTSGWMRGSKNNVPLPRHR